MKDNLRTTFFLIIIIVCGLGLAYVSGGNKIVSHFTTTFGGSSSLEPITNSDVDQAFEYETKLTQAQQDLGKNFVSGVYDAGNADPDTQDLYPEIQYSDINLHGYKIGWLVTTGYILYGQSSEAAQGGVNTDRNYMGTINVPKKYIANAAALYNQGIKKISSHKELWYSFDDNNWNSDISRSGSFLGYGPFSGNSSSDDN